MVTGLEVEIRSAIAGCAEGDEEHLGHVPATALYRDVRSVPGLDHWTTFLEHGNHFSESFTSCPFRALLRQIGL